MTTPLLAHTLRRLADAVSSATALEDVYQSALVAIREALEVDRAAVLLFDPDGVMRFKAWHGLSDDYRRAVEGHTPWSPDTIAPEPIAVPDVEKDGSLAAFRSVFARENIRSLVFVPLLARGKVSGKFMLYWDRPFELSDEALEAAVTIGSFIGFAVERAQADLQLRHLYAEQRAQRQEAQRLGDRAAFLAHMGKTLASSLDYHQTLAAVANLAVPRLADWCAVDILREDGTLERVAVAHVDPAKVELARELQRRYPPDPASTHGIYAVIRSGRPVVMSEVPDELLVAASRDSEHLQTLRALEIVSYICVPLTAHGRTFGGLTFVTAESQRRYTEEDLPFAEEVAARSALAVDNARAYEHARRLAHELNAAQQRLAQIVESVPGIIWEAWGQPDAAHQRINFVSRYVEQMLGYSVEEWLETSNFWLSIVHPDDREQAARIAAEGFAAGRPHVNQFRWIAKDGRVLWVEARAAVIHDDAGAPKGMRGVTFDISDRKDAEAALALAKSEAERANRLKDEFLATLSHELRTPLNAIVGYAAMLRSGILSGEKQAQAFEVVERNALSLTQMVEDVLDISRIVSGKMRLTVRPVQLADVLDYAIETVRPAAEAKGVRLEAIVGRMDTPVFGDPDRLQQVLWNLLSNAVKFTDRGGRVQVRLERVDSNMEIVVADTGRGIAPEFLPHMFDRFRQADARFTREHGGLGLGLAISRHIVEAHGGQISAVSEGQGRGATFRVQLPLMMVHADAPGGERRAAPFAPQAAFAPQACLEGVRVLAVDDDPDGLKLLSTILEAAGATTTVVASARQALDTLERQPYDVLVADLGMPDIDGLELIERTRRSVRIAVRNIPAAALTAYARSEDRVRALQAGYNMHLAKPVNPAELVAAVAALASRVANRS